ncbi:hypothetical protein NM688_g5012 [Phlebia brevispora]|uniref:Uncharacterized protein n=1 Tax=Phlebia brevispora TaxID=194682 RepID=A0ACC1T114_9APHY|nr:hypothetical protein NM688_g5012 [Phlebia brevispora]
MDGLYALLLVQLSQARWCSRVMAIVRLSIASLPITNRRTAPHTKPGGRVIICALRNMRTIGASSDGHMSKLLIFSKYSTVLHRLRTLASPVNVQKSCMLGNIGVPCAPFSARPSAATRFQTLAALAKAQRHCSSCKPQQNPGSGKTRRLRTRASQGSILLFFLMHDKRRNYTQSLPTTSKLINHIGIQFSIELGRTLVPFMFSSTLELSILSDCIWAIVVRADSRTRLENSASEEVSDRLQAVQITPRSRSITTGAANMASSSDHMASRAAIRSELAGRLRFNDESVLQRLGTDRLTDDFVDTCSSDFTSDSANSDNLRDLRSIVHRAESGGEKNETQMYSPLVGLRPIHIALPRLTSKQGCIFNYIADYQWADKKGCPDGISRRFDVSSSRILTSEVYTLGFPPLQPDLSILDPETPVVNAGRGNREPRYSPQWRYRSAFVEVKVTRVQGPTSTSNETITEIVQQAADYARLHMAARPFQLFSVCLLVYGLKFCVAIFDRSGVIFSPEGDLDTGDGWKLFVRIVRCLSVTMTDEDLGRDPTTQLLPSDDPTISRLREQVRALHLRIPEGFPAFSVSLGGATSRRWLTIAMVWSSLSLVGRGTTVWLVKELLNGKPQGAVKVMKTAWRSSRRMPEAKIYKALQNQQAYRSHPCVAKFDTGDDVCFQDKPEDTISVAALRATGVIPLDTAEEDKILHRIFLSPVGRPIWEYETEGMLIRGIKAAIQGHKFLYEHGILHRDISAGNVLLAQNPEQESEGFITDLDYAWISNDSDPAKSVREVPHGGHITASALGTYQFMAARILKLMKLSQTNKARRARPLKIVNQVRDDLESFLWVFCYAIMRHHMVRYPSDSDAQREFHTSFGHLNLDAIMMSRASCQPLFVLPFFEQSLSEELLEWLEEQYMSMENGFVFTYETLDAWMDSALSVIVEV